MSMNACVRFGIIVSHVIDSCDNEQKEKKYISLYACVRFGIVVSHVIDNCDNEQRSGWRNKKKSKHVKHTQKHT